MAGAACQHRATLAGGGVVTLTPAELFVLRARERGLSFRRIGEMLFSELSRGRQLYRVRQLYAQAMVKREAVVS